MRVGDFSVEVVAADGGVREIESGHVLARPGRVYKLRLRNHGPLRAVADISIDGHSVTGNGLVIDAWKAVDLERPIHATERGRFTVIAEGNEQVFGSDGGRDNPELGLIEARFRRELPSHSMRDLPSRSSDPWEYPRPIVTMPSPGQPPETSPPPRFTPPIWNGPEARLRGPLGRGIRHDDLSALLAASAPLADADVPAPRSLPDDTPAMDAHDLGDAIQRAAGTGLTGQSAQEFTPVHVGTLESEATVIRLRLVIATDEAISAPRPLPASEHAPARPAPRP
jgi:hypothetical protein